MGFNSGFKGLSFVVYCCLSALLVKSVGDVVEVVNGSDDAGKSYRVDVSEVLARMCNTTDVRSKPLVI